MTDASGVQLSPARLRLLQSLLRSKGIERNPSQVVDRRADPRAPVPLTFSQNRFWFLDQLSAGDSAHVVPAALRVHGEFSFAVFTQACEEVVRRHESLRTVFIEVDGHPLQHVLKSLPPEVTTHDLQSLAPEAVQPTVQQRVSALSARRFDLTAGPLLRVELLRVGPADAVILLNLHHIVSDLWSMGVLMRELTGTYGALVTGRASDLPDLLVQYPDFAVWQQDSSSEVGWPADLAYWARQLRDTPPDLGLATDRPRPQEGSQRGSSVPVELPPALVTAVREVARSERVTVFMVLAATFTVLLSRLSDNDDVVIGTPVANRTLGELEPLIGLFVNTLALRTDLSGDPTFRELLHRVSTCALEAYEHQGVPFDRVVEELAPERFLGRPPLFDVMFAYQNVPLPAWGVGPITVEPIPLEVSHAEFDLLLDLFEDGETIWGRLGYSLDLIDEKRARSMAASFRRILRGLTADPEQRISEVSLLGDSERHELLARGRGPAGELPETTCLHEIFEELARAEPAALAIRGEGDELSYGALNRRANQLAHRLLRSGVGADVLVGVSMARSVGLVVGLLAVLKAGGTYLPLDPAYPQERLEHLVEDSGVSVLLTDLESLPGLPQVAGEVLCLDELEAELAAESGDDPGAGVSGEALAYVIYSSGSTGRPLGSICTQAALRNRLSGLQDLAALEPGDRLLVKSPIAFEDSIHECLLPLLAGAAMVLARPGADTDSRYLAATVRDERITVLLVVPSLLRMLVREPVLTDCTGLRTVISSGGTLPRELAHRFFAASGAQLYNCYRSAEVGLAAMWECRRDAAGTVPIGFPTASTQLYVLDRFLVQVPAGVAGELFVGGRSLSCGYLSQPELTAQRFIADPFHPGAGATLCRTGDLVRYGTGGALELLGGLEDQVRLRGSRVDLAEIEAVLTDHPLVGEAIVVAGEVAAGNLRLVAYLTGRQDPTAGDLVAFVRERLPEYLVPSAFVHLPVIPLSRKGKVDRAALPDPAPERLGSATVYQAPRGALERSIAQVWRELLEVEQVGVDDNFFELGGQSLLAIKLVARLNSAHGVHLHVREVFNNQTVGRLAARVSELSELDPDPTLVAAIPIADRGQDLPLGFAQEQLCVHHPKDPGDACHNVVTGLLLKGSLDRVALAGSLDAISQRHEALRTRIVRQPAGLVQKVDDIGLWPLAAADLRAVPEPDRADRLQSLIEAEGRRPFRIEAEHLVRGTVIEWARDEHVLVLVMHHLVTDNWSYGVLIRDLCEFYGARVDGREPSLPELAIQYPDYAAWQRRQLAGGGFADQVHYWRRQLTDLPPAMDLTALAHEGVGAATGSTLPFEFDPAVAQGLRAIAQRHGATLFMVLLAAFDVLLWAHCGRDDIPVGIKEAGRDRPETAELVGYFVNTLVVRADLSVVSTFADLVEQVREKTLDAYAHPSVPMWAEGIQHDPGVPPVARLDPAKIIFNLLNAPLPSVDLRGLQAVPLDIGDGYVFSEVLGNLAPDEVDLALIMREHGAGLRGTWLFSTDAIDAMALTSMMRHWERLVPWLVDEPEGDLGRLRHRLENGPAIPPTARLAPSSSGTPTTQQP